MIVDINLEGENTRMIRNEISMSKGRKHTMRRMPIYLLGLFLLAPVADAEKLALLEKPGGSVFFPTWIAVNKEQIFVRHEYRSPIVIHIYSRKNFKYLARVREDGYGFEYIRGEFSIPDFYVHRNSVQVFSENKITVYSRKGILQREIEIPPELQKSALKPVRENYLGSQGVINESAGSETAIFTLYDANLKKIKDLYSRTKQLHLPLMKNKKPVFHLFQESLSTGIIEDKILIGDTSKGFFIAVFDKEGNPVREINLEWQKLRVTEKDKKREKDLLPGSENAIFEFPEYFPAYQSFQVFDSQIFVTTYPITEQNERLVLDIEGKIVKKVSLPEITLFTIHQNKCYYLTHNDSDQIELHATDIFKR
jgi:hypothetical protein